MLAKTIPIEITTIAAPIMKPRRLQTPRHLSYVPDPLLWRQRLINDVRISMSSLILTRNPGTMCSGAPAGD